MTLGVIISSDPYARGYGSVRTDGFARLLSAAQFDVRAGMISSKRQRARKEEVFEPRHGQMMRQKFARHLRINVTEEGGAWAADAVYTHLPTLPDGPATPDTDVIVAAPEETGIPTV